MTEETLTTPGRRAWAAQRAMDEGADTLKRVAAELRTGATFASYPVREQLHEWVGALERQRIELEDAGRLLAADVEPPAVPRAPEPALPAF